MSNGESKIIMMESAVNTTEVTEHQKELYNMTISNIMKFSTRKTGKKNIGLVAVPLSLLFVDKRYQGLRDHKRINKLISNWDESKLSPIVIVCHPEEYRFAVVDGQGRLTAATKIGYDSLYAIVLMDAPQDDLSARLKFEAEIFVGQDSETETLKSLEKHLARVIIGDHAALILEDMFNKYNVSYTNTKGSREASVLGSYPTTYNVAKRHGKYCLEFIFSIIRNAGWDKESNGYATYVTEALKDIWVTFQNGKDRNKIYNYLSDELRKIDPTTFSSKARAKYDKRDTRVCCKLYIEDMVFEGLGLKRPDLVA